MTYQETMHTDNMNHRSPTSFIGVAFASASSSSVSQGLDPHELKTDAHPEWLVSIVETIRFKIGEVRQRRGLVVVPQSKTQPVPFRPRKASSATC